MSVNFTRQHQVKTNEPIKSHKGDIIHRIASAIMLDRPMARLGRWFESEVFKFDYYELRGDEVVSVRRPKHRFKTQDVRTWQQIILCFGVAVIAIEFADGKKVRLSDKYERLLRILQRAAPGKELPWTAET